MFLISTPTQQSFSSASVCTTGLGCPASRGETIEEACMVHGADADALVADLNKAIA